MPRLIAPVAAALCAAALLTSCAATPPHREPRDSSRQASAGAAQSVPETIALDAAVTVQPESMAITAEQLYDAGWFSVSHRGESTFENGDCTVVLRSESRDATEVVSDREATELTLRALLGDAASASPRVVTVATETGETAVEALVASTDDSSEQRVTLARSIRGQVVIASLACALGVSAQSVFERTVLPALRIGLQPSG